MRTIVFLIVMLAFASCIYAQATKKQPEFILVYIPGSGNWVPNVSSCKAIYSDSTTVDLAPLLNLTDQSTSFATNKLKVLSYFYGKGYELIGTTMGSSSGEFYFKLKEVK